MSMNNPGYPSRSRPGVFSALAARGNLFLDVREAALAHVRALWAGESGGAYALAGRELHIVAQWGLLGCGRGL